MVPRTGLPGKVRIEMLLLSDDLYELLELCRR